MDLESRALYEGACFWAWAKFFFHIQFLIISLDMINSIGLNTTLGPFWGNERVKFWFQFEMRSRRHCVHCVSGLTMAYGEVSCSSSATGHVINIHWVVLLYWIGTSNFIFFLSR